MTDWVQGDDLKDMVKILEHAAEHGLKSIEERDEEFPDKIQPSPSGDIISLSGSFSYRIKPQPQVVYGVRYTATRSGLELFTSEWEAKRCHAEHVAPTEIVKFQEVVE